MPESASVAIVAVREVELSSDGRVRRRQRSGQAIVDAMLGLVGEGVLQPTAQQVAMRAGVGLRTVFRRFADMESLFAEIGARVQAEALPLLGAPPRGGDVRERARALVAGRIAFFEHLGPYKRSANARRARSPFLSRGHARLVGGLRADLIERLPELQRAPAHVLDAVELATSFEAWDRLRTEQRLGCQRARAVIEHLVLGLLAAVDPAVRKARR